MNLGSGQITQLTDGRNNNTEPTRFPDGQSLAFTSDGAGVRRFIKSAPAAGAAQRLTWEGSQNRDSEVSSDGKFTVMVSTNSGAQHIAKQDLGSGAVQVLTGTFWMKRLVLRQTAPW